jgi:beta-glucosidase
LSTAYTTFDYSGLGIKVSAKAGPTTGPQGPGGPQDLFDTVGSISVTIKNSGKVTGAEVAQLYIGLPASAPLTPPKQLRGFQKVNVEPHESSSATFALTKRDISYWDIKQQKWIVPSGTFNVYVGSSSRDIRLKGKFTVDN